MQISIPTVIGSLEHDARMAMAEAERTPRYADVIVFTERANRWRAMAEAVRQALVTAPDAAPKPRAKRSTSAATAPRANKVTSIGALAFWAAHGQAVAAITERYGSAWKVRASFGQTELVTLASGLRNCTTERGTKLRWGKDHRVPCAAYWPGGEIPSGAIVIADYARDTTAAVYGPPHITHDAAWHAAHGYILIDGNWVKEIQHRIATARAEAIKDAKEQRRIVALERAALSYGPQPMTAAPPFSDIADDIELSEAAD